MFRFIHSTLYLKLLFHNQAANSKAYWLVDKHWYFYPSINEINVYLLVYLLFIFSILSLFSSTLSNNILYNIKYFFLFWFFHSVKFICFHKIILFITVVTLLSCHPLSVHPIYLYLAINLYQVVKLGTFQIGRLIEVSC